jgi:catechol 2,3-dioxygenase-like lactoylglutathione lyase family enzyme
MAIYISGIQQIGIGVPRVHEAFAWYRKHLGMDVPVFEEAAEANLMLPYTGGQPHKRHAILALNMKGGGGMEIWQYTSRTPQPAAFELLAGDLGLFAGIIKSPNVARSREIHAQEGLNLVGPLSQLPNGWQVYTLTDRYGNLFRVMPSNDWFSGHPSHTGGPMGMTLGVSNMERSMDFYKNLLGYDQVLFDAEGVWDDLKDYPGGSHRLRRVLLTHGKPRQGAFSQLFGPSVLELWQVLDRTPQVIRANRYWGDLGFIHLCFDINGWEAMRNRCAEAGHPFTVDSTLDRPVFDMGEAAGNFAYIEDPDGTLIEFVETIKIPILKKWGWYLNLRKRDPAKPLPKWMLKALGLARVKD